MVCLARLEEEARRNMNLTEQNRILKQLNKLRDAEFWVLLLGFTLILEKVVEVSLEAQNSYRFASTSLYNVLKSMHKLRELSLKAENIFFNETGLYSGLGSFNDHIKRISGGEVDLSAGADRADSSCSPHEAGVFKIELSDRVRKLAATTINKMRTGETFDEDQEISYEEITNPDIPVEAFSVEMLEKCDKSLKECAKMFVE